MTGAEHARSDTTHIAPGDRFDYWRERVTPLRLEPLGRPRDFWARGETLRSGEVTAIAMTRGPAVARWRRSDTERQDRLRLILLAPALGGAASWYGHRVPLGRGLAVLSGAGDGWWRAPSGLRGIEIDTPRSAVPISDSDLARIHTEGRLGRDPVFTTLIRPMLTSMAGHLDALTGPAETDLATCWIALLTMLARSVTAQDVDGADVAPARRLQAERYICAHLADPHLNPDAIAAALHLSRRSLYATVFPREGGVAAHVRAQRLTRAHDLLCTTTLPVAAIAAAVGLPDAAHFSRLFRRTYGHTPRDLRNRRAE
jgi:AraC-like DNA-binding protein